jgi:hypothetical protein
MLLNDNWVAAFYNGHLSWKGTLHKKHKLANMGHESKHTAFILEIRLPQDILKLFFNSDKI